MEAQEAFNCKVSNFLKLFPNLQTEISKEHHQNYRRTYSVEWRIFMTNWAMDRVGSFFFAFLPTNVFPPHLKPFTAMRTVELNLIVVRKIILYVAHAYGISSRLKLKKEEQSQCPGESIFFRGSHSTANSPVLHIPCVAAHHAAGRILANAGPLKCKCFVPDWNS